MFGLFTCNRCGRQGDKIDIDNHSCENARPAIPMPIIPHYVDELDRLARRHAMLLNLELEYYRIMSLISLCVDRNLKTETVQITITKQAQVAAKSWHEILQLAETKEVEK